MHLHNCWIVIFLGDKSEVLDIDTPDLQRYPEFMKACRYECFLDPGDLLFIPGMILYPHQLVKLLYTYTQPSELIAFKE